MRANAIAVLLLLLLCQQVFAMECVAIANGTPLPKALVLEVVHGRTVIALDGAVRALREVYLSQIKPDFVIGDFDSCSLMEREHFKSAQIIHAPSQDVNDLEKGIMHCDALGATEIWLLNALGLDRLDHSIAAMHILKKYHKPNRRLRLVSTNQILEFVKNAELSFKAMLGEAVGVFGFPKATVTSRGLEYEMNGYLVEGPQFSSSNYVADRHVVIEIKGEALVSYPYL